MLMRPHTLSIITTHQCTAACDHCCFNCTPTVKDAIPITRIHSLIDEALAIDSIRVVVFTGGECFLLGEDLYDLIAHAKKNGFITRCVSNGYWATERNVAGVVDRLCTVGLDEINFSTGEEHGTYVPPARVRAGAAACNAKGIRTLVNIELFNDTTFDAVDFLESSCIKSAVETRQIKVQRNVWIKGDGNRELAHAPAHSRFTPERIGGCHTALNVVAITPKQLAVACCGLHLERIPDLQLGSIAHDTLQSVLHNAPDDFLKIWIHVHGPERILQFVKDKVPEYELPIDSVHPCTTCLHLYQDELAKSVIREHYLEIEESVCKTYLAGLAKGEVGRLMSSSAFGDT